jgi:hypothetical protein
MDIGTLSIVYSRAKNSLSQTEPTTLVPECHANVDSMGIERAIERY